MDKVVENVKDFAEEHKVAIAVGVASVCGLIAFRRYVAGGACRSKVRLDGKTVLITGANTGIGKETAKDLAKRGLVYFSTHRLKCSDIWRKGYKTIIRKNQHVNLMTTLHESSRPDQCSKPHRKWPRSYKPLTYTTLARAPQSRCIIISVLYQGTGARVLIACRDKTRAEEAATEVRQFSGNQDVHIYILDLASLASVRKCAEEVKAKEKRLDILINNAGVMICPYMKTADGYEMQFGTNHLGHFLFTNLLLDLIKASAPSRIVNVSSLGHVSGKINFDDINGEKNYNRITAYSQSKLANVLFTRELSKRLEGTNVTTNSLHPGSINTDLQRHVPLWLRAILLPFFLPFFKTPEQGAQTSIYCAISEDLEGVSGKYFSDCALKEPAKQAKDDEVAARLWALSEKMVGLTL